MKALIGFGRCYIPFTDSPSCSELKSVGTISMHQLRANTGVGGQWIVYTMSQRHGRY